MPLELSPTQTAFNARGDGTFNKPFGAQVDFFKQKINLPTEHYDDILKAAHDRAFVVAGANKADLLTDLNAAITKAIDDGKSLKWFQKEFDNIVDKHGWRGWTGDGTKDGRDWRTKIIYNTNLSSSYAAGRWAEMNDPDLLKIRPYWKYKHNDNVLHPRPLHLAWNGLVLRHDDPWWKTHFPPNGWGCRCRVIPVKAGDYTGDVAPDNGTVQKIDRNGVAHTIPAGIDYGWDYAPGSNRATPLKDIIDQKLIRIPATIGADMWQALKPSLNLEVALQWHNTLDNWLADDFTRNQIIIIGALSPPVVDWLEKNTTIQLLSSEIALSDKLVKGAKQLRHENDQNGLTLEELRALPSLVNNPGAVYLDTRSGKLILVAEEIGPTKIAIEFLPKKSSTLNVNSIVSVFRVSDQSIAGEVKGGKWKIIEIKGR